MSVNGKRRTNLVFGKRRAAVRPTLAFEPGRFLVRPSKSEVDPTSGWPMVSSDRHRLGLSSWTRRRGEHFQAGWTGGVRVQREGA